MEQADKSMKQSVANMPMVTAYGYWDVRNRSEQKRSLDDSDIKSLVGKHALKRQCTELKDADWTAIRDMYDGQLKKHEEMCKKRKACTKTWNMYRLTQNVNMDRERVFEALVVAQSHQDASFICPMNSPAGWWAKETYEENVFSWMQSWRNDEPMPNWYVASSYNWVHPAFVKAEFITSFDGDPAMRGKCIAKNWC